MRNSVTTDLNTIFETLEGAKIIKSPLAKTHCTPSVPPPYPSGKG